ncbi:MAG: hypothetical protein KAW12_29975 [Candidatus Aminicenantes bacterium]|nr:hypothetical protein [Candidatus Aminicenantes bacterium]
MNNYRDSLGAYMAVSTNMIRIISHPTFRWVHFSSGGLKMVTIFRGIMLLNRTLDGLTAVITATCMKDVGCIKIYMITNSRLKEVKHEK